MSAELAEGRRARIGFLLAVGLIATFAAAKAVLFDTLDPDCFWHLRVADQLLHDGIGPLVDHLSFVSTRQPWTPYSWLAELGMRAVWNAGGYRLAVAVQAMVQAGIVLLMAGCCLAQQARFGRDRQYLSATIATAVGTFLSLPYLSFRPVTAALLLLWAITYPILRDRARGESTWGVWCVLPLTALLTNLHLFSFLVPAVLLALMAGSMLEQRQASARRYGMLMAGATLAFAATPMLPGLMRTAFFYGTQDTMVGGPAIAEMQSIARGPLGVVSAILVAGVLTCCVMQRHRLRIGDGICLIAGTLLLLKLGRFAPVFAMAAIPPLATVLPPLKDRVLARPPVWAALAVVLMLSVVKTVSAFPKPTLPLSSWLNRHGPEAPGYPCAAADFIDQHVVRDTGHLLNEFSWGGYLSWRLGDRYQVLVDGRTQVYSARVWRQTTLGSDSELQRYLASVHADAALVGKDSGRFGRALERLGWVTVHQDDRARVMVPGATATARIE